MSIPEWNMAGVVPPIRPDADPAGKDRSPYRVSLSDFVDRFCLSVDRSIILRGLIDLRAQLHSIGITKGFQWIDGSFLEHIEDVEDRPPNDVDVVTFAFLPVGQTQVSFFPTLQPYLDRDRVKTTYKVDHFIRILPQVNIHDVCYWYSLWSHRRDGMWKGYVEVDLAPTDDTHAAGLLATKIGAGFQP
ncbi:hypothetical protein F1645_13670 [Novacetimonas hansenii]|uniref:Uncharacterized protein n=2 Tax=Novacetimonas hansenii TaxID=436 RepID=D5QBW9_NOVHA|nr:hypothetical protein GXY_03078 [Novacetimonas hansenii ATCC 23769]